MPKLYMYFFFFLSFNLLMSIQAPLYYNFLSPLLMWPPFFFGVIPTYGVPTVRHDKELNSTVMQMRLLTRLSNVAEQKSN